MALQREREAQKIHKKHEDAKHEDACTGADIALMASRF